MADGDITLGRKRGRTSSSTPSAKRARTSLPTIHQLWIDMKQPFTQKIQLPRLAQLSIESFLHFGYPVKVHTYHRGITNLPRGAELCDARATIPLSEYRSYKVHARRTRMHSSPEPELVARPHIAQFSDLFRVEIIYREGGWWADIDMICINPLPTPSKKDQGVIFCASPNKLNSIRCFHGADTSGGQFSNTIFYAPAKHPLLAQIITYYRRERFEKSHFPHFIILMQDMFEIIKANGYEKSIRHPHQFVPYPWWNNRHVKAKVPERGKLTSFGHVILRPSQIMKRSSTMNYYKGMMEEMKTAPKSCMLWEVTRLIEARLGLKFELDYWDN